MDNIKQYNQRQSQMKITTLKRKSATSQVNKPQAVQPILKNKNIQRNNNNNPKISPKKVQPKEMIPQDTVEPVTKEKLENGEKNSPKKIVKRSNIRSLRKGSNSCSEKNLPILSIGNLVKINEQMTPNENKNTEILQENNNQSISPKKNVTFLDKKKRK
jgi:hypothetical protein